MSFNDLKQGVNATISCTILCTYFLELKMPVTFQTDWHSFFQGFFYLKLNDLKSIQMLLNAYKLKAIQ